MDNEQRPQPMAETWQEFGQALRGLFRQLGDTFILPLLNALNRLIDRYPILERVPQVPRRFLYGIWITAGILGVLAGATQ